MVLIFSSLFVISAFADPPKLPFSSIRIAGDMVYVSGTSASPGKSKEGSIEALTKDIIENIKGLLAKEGLTLNDVVKTTVFLTDMNDFQTMSQTYAKMFSGNDQFPARTTIGVKSLPFGVPIEIECIAYIGKKR